MARDGGGVGGGGGGSPGAERRRVALRALLLSSSGGGGQATGEAEAATRTAPVKGGLLRGLRCTSAAASQAIAPETPRVPADWRGLGCAWSAAAVASQAHAPDAVAARPTAADWRGLGCASAAAAVQQAHAPVVGAPVSRRSEEWRGRRRRNGRERRKARGVGGGGGGSGGGGGGAGVGVGGGDVWCTPGIPFAAEASSVDCVVAPHQTMGTRRRAEADRPRRERPGAPPAPARRVTMREHMSSSPLSSPPHHDMSFLDADRAPSGRIRQIGGGRRRAHARVEEEMMFRTRILLGRMGIYDQYQDWRLDVDNMTYEELLDLEDRIGYVSTGLREDEIIQSLRMVKYSAFNPKHFSTEMDRRCSICQEEFEANEETGKLSCGHSYHVHCIKQWLSRKNACPVCKTTVSKS